VGAGLRTGLLLTADTPLMFPIIWPRKETALGAHVDVSICPRQAQACK
jgi:hypothetical protein